MGRQSSDRDAKEAPAYSGSSLIDVPTLPPEVCSAPDQSVPGCPPPTYVGENGTEGECGGVALTTGDHDLVDPYHRLVQGTLDTPGVVPAPTKGIHFNVLLPRDYDPSSTRRYPVLYLRAGFTSNQDRWILASDLIKYTDGFVGDQAGKAAIVVMWAGNDVGFDVDWRDGRWLWESMILEHLIPYIDSHFNTLADRSHRAIAGSSNGGNTAMHIAARHPDLFVAVGGFSGAGFSDPVGEAFMHSLFGPAESQCGGSQPTETGPLGNLVTDDVWWHNAPTDLAENLGGLAVYIAVGDGTPCDQEDVQALATNYLAGLDAVNHKQMEGFDAALTAAGVAHTSDFYGCGVHTFRYFQRDLHAFSPIMLAAFGRSAPSSFNYRTADSAEHVIGNKATSVYGWTFTPDPDRAPEFLDVHDASALGVTLIGSGHPRVTTAALFTPFEDVALTGAIESHAVADSQGRISFTVDLGPVHTIQQYTAVERALEAAAGDGYFKTQMVKFG